MWGGVMIKYCIFCAYGKEACIIIIIITIINFSE